MGDEQTNRAAAQAIDQLTLKVRAATESMKGLSAAASASGFQSMNSGFQLMGATLGSVLQPAFVLLSAGVMTLADAFWNDLKPGLSATVDGFVAFGEAIVSATRSVYDFIKATGKFLSDLNIVSPTMDLIAANKKGRSLDEALAAGNRVREAGAPLKPMTIEEMHANRNKAAAAAEIAGPKEEGFNFKKTFSENLKGIIADQKMAMGGGASFGSIADAWKKMQLQTVQTNFQAKMMDRFSETVKLLDRIAMGIGKQQPAIGN